MNRFLPNRKGVVFCLLLIALGVVAAPGVTKTRAPKEELGKTAKLLHRARLAAQDRAGEKKYEQRDPEIAPWIEDAALANPDNAALLYYQAFLLRPEPNVATIEKIHDVLFGGEPDRLVRRYLGHCLPMIQVVEIASRIPQCTWGIWHGPGPGFSRMDLRSEVGHLNQILMVDARTLAADGHYRAALERCLTLRRLARHLSDDPELVFISRSPDIMALRAVQHVLGVMPPDVDILTWFRGQFAVVQGATLSFAEKLQADFKSLLNFMRMNPKLLATLRNRLVEKAEDEQAKEIARNLTDEQLLSRPREAYARFFDSIFRILDSKMTYEQKCAQMQRLINKLKGEYGTDPVVAYVIRSGTDGIIDYARQYPSHVGHQAHINGIKAAVEVYLVLAKTGQLPEKLPDHLPKDPFTGRDFVYEITDEGFALRCQDKEFLRRKNRFLEFKLQK